MEARKTTFFEEFLGATVDAIFWPFMLLYLLFVGLHRETWQYLYRAETFFKDNPDYVGLQLELSHARDVGDIIDLNEHGEDVLLTEKGKWDACKWVESVYVEQIRAAQYTEAEARRDAELRDIAAFKTRQRRRGFEEAARLNAQRINLERQLRQVEAQQTTL